MGIAVQLEEKVRIFNEIPADVISFKVYCVTQGVKGQEYTYGKRKKKSRGNSIAERLAEDATVSNKKSHAKSKARKHSKSAELRDLALKLALEHVARLAEKENNTKGYDIIAIGNPKILFYQPKLRELKNGYQSALTIEINATSYRRKK